MSDIYYLSKKELPTIPVLHDCVIKHIKVENQFIIMDFEDDITYHDGICAINSKAKSISIKIHLLDPPSFDILKWKRLRNRKIIYDYLDSSKLSSFSNRRLEYLYHNVGYCSIIIKLYCHSEIILDIQADYVQFDWIY